MYTTTQRIFVVVLLGWCSLWNSSAVATDSKNLAPAHARDHPQRTNSQSEQLQLPAHRLDIQQHQTDRDVVSDVNKRSPSRGINRSATPPIRLLEGLTEHRTYQGHNNNLITPGMGSTNSSLERWMPNDYSDTVAQPAGLQRPSARLISNQVSDQAYSRPNPVNASDFLWQWGQFLDHDIDLTDGMDPPELMPIAVPAGDPYFDPDNTGTAEIIFNRSIYDPLTGDSNANPRQQINEISAWIDASNVYGSDLERANALRTLDGTGQLKVSSGNFLPYNLDGLPNAGGSGSTLFLAGDVRANEQVGLTAMHTLFVREHNRLAAEIATSNPTLGGEDIYHNARRLVGGIMQFITYNEFLPLLLGSNVMPEYQGYDAQQNADISSVFSAAAYRFGHSALSPVLRRINIDGDEHPLGHLNLLDAFFSPDVITADDSLEAILRGLASQVCQNNDVYVIDDVRNFLFGPPGAGGLDLVSLNIQRGRDHGLRSYAQAREMMGLTPVNSFAQITSDSPIRQNLQNTYGQVSNVDLWTGGLAENHVPGALVGELFHKVIKKQFQALRDGDRFWYQSYLSAAEIALVESSTLAQVIRRNTAIDLEIDDNVFIVSNLDDTDLDTVEDIRDNCLLTTNPNQLDGDHDGYGNACDADFSNDGWVNFLDLSIFAQHFQSNDPVTDLNGDGIVDFADLNVFGQLFLSAPGPSGLH